MRDTGGQLPQNGHLAGMFQLRRQLPFGRHVRPYGNDLSLTVFQTMPPHLARYPAHPSIAMHELKLDSRGAILQRGMFS